MEANGSDTEAIKDHVAGATNVKEQLSSLKKAQATAHKAQLGQLQINGQKAALQAAKVAFAPSHPGHFSTQQPGT
jgi:hypothetical protein